jgi:hypothetical protein
MEKIKTDKLKEKIINHLIAENYNLHQYKDNSIFYSAYTPYNKSFIISFHEDYLLIAVLYDFNRFNIGKKKILKLVNDLNNLSLIMKFSVDSKSILKIAARVQRVYNKKAFQNLLDDIEYDLSILFNDEMEKYLKFFL